MGVLVDEAFAKAVLSEFRQETPLSPLTLSWINTFLDEFLLLTISPDAKPFIDIPLSTATYKSSVTRLLPNHLGRNLSLEAEVVVKSLSRERSFRNDPALAKDAKSVGRGDAALVLEELFSWLEEIGQPLLSQLSNSLATQTVASLLVGSYSAKVIAANTLSARQLQDDACSSLILTPAIAAYIASVTFELAQFVLRSLARVVERDSSVIEALPAHLFLAFKEDQCLWDLLQRMQCRQTLERSASLIRKSSVSSRARSHRQASVSRPSTANITRKSSDSSAIRRPRTASTTEDRSPPLFSLPLQMDSRTQTPDDESADVRRSFEELIHSNETRILSLTPDRFGQPEAPRSVAVNAFLTNSPQNKTSAKKAPARPMTAPAGGRSRLQARAAISEENDTDSEDDELLYGKKRPKKESLMDLLKSDPPWASSLDDTPSSNGQGKAARMMGAPVSTAPGPQGKAARMMGAPASNVDNDTSKLFDTKDIPTPSMRSSRSGNARKLQPKDERAAPVGSRHLIEFFGGEPPPSHFAPSLVPPSPTNLTSSPPSSRPSLESGHKKSSGRLRHMMSKLSGLNNSSAPKEPKAAPTLPPPTGSTMARVFEERAKDDFPEFKRARSPDADVLSRPPQRGNSLGFHKSSSERRLNNSSLEGTQSLRSSASVSANISGHATGRDSPADARPYATNSRSAPRTQSQPQPADPSLSRSLSFSQNSVTSTRSAALDQPKNTKQSRSHVAMVMGLPTPENSREEITQLAASPPKVNPLSNKAFLPNTPPESPERARVRRVPSPRVESEVVVAVETARQVRSSPWAPPPDIELPKPPSHAPQPDEDAQPLKASLPRSTYAKSSRESETHPIAAPVVQPVAVPAAPVHQAELSSSVELPPAVELPSFVRQVEAASVAPIEQIRTKSSTMSSQTEAGSDVLEAAELLKAFIVDVRGKMAGAGSVEECLTILDQVWKAPAAAEGASDTRQLAVEQPLAKQELVAEPQLEPEQVDVAEMEARMAEWFLCGFECPYDDQSAIPTLSPDSGTDESESEISDSRFLEPTGEHGLYDKQRNESFASASEHQGAIAI